MDPIQIFVENATALENEALRALWPHLTAEQKALVEKSLETNPLMSLEEGKVQKKIHKKDGALSRKAVRYSQGRKGEKTKTSRKAGKIINKLRKLSGKKPWEKEETFKEWAKLETPDDSRGPIQVLLATKEGGADTRKKMEDLASHLYSELGLPAWVQEGKEQGTSDREYILFTSLFSFGPELIDSVQKEITKFLDKED